MKWVLSMTMAQIHIHFLLAPDIVVSLALNFDMWHQKPDNYVNDNWCISLCPLQDNKWVFEAEDPENISCLKRTQEEMHQLSIVTDAQVNTGQCIRGK